MRKIAWILAAALAAPGLVLANDELNYNYVELGYLRADPDNLSSEDGIGFRSSSALGANFHIFGGYDWDAVRRPHANLSGVDAHAYRLGLGYNTGISDKVDFVGRVAWERIDIGSFDDDGFSAEVGIRAAVAPSFEAGAALRYVDFDGSATSLVLNGQYKFNSTWGISAEADINKDGNSFLIGPRLSF
ncbi:MAG: hypothetical protein KDI51_01830 [Xanthomonadales bacterium]|nr:hypothetical protein [Xanthomonadales bacterium]MCB1633295.1 hypothetical protein [Xanthomonadales bacterium]